MTGDQFKTIRRELGLTARQLGKALGYRGNENTLGVQIRSFESDKREIPEPTGRLMEMFGRFGIPNKWLYPTFVCIECGAETEINTRTDQVYCSDACKMRAYRKRLFQPTN